MNTPESFVPKFNSDGLLPAIVVENVTLKVLMMAYMNRESLEYTLTHNTVCFYSRSRNSLWIKGETSGNHLQLKEVCVDCDQDCLLLKVKVLGDGNVCHTGEKSCFYRRVENGSLYFL